MYSFEFIRMFNFVAKLLRHPFKISLFHLINHGDVFLNLFHLMKKF